MKRYSPIVLVLATVVLGGCYWISGPWVGPDRIRDKYDEIEVGMLRSEVEDKLGEPSEIVYVTPEGKEPAEGSQEAVLLYKYDYPDEPLLIGVKIDYFGIVVEKRFEDEESIAQLAEKTADEEKVGYPGAPTRRFRLLLKQKKRHPEQ